MSELLSSYFFFWKMSLSQLPPELQVHLLLEFHPNALLNYCQLNQVSRSICQSETFLRGYLRRRYQLDINSSTQLECKSAWDKFKQIIYPIQLATTGSMIEFQSGPERQYVNPTFRDSLLQAVVLGSRQMVRDVLDILLERTRCPWQSEDERDFFLKTISKMPHQDNYLSLYNSNFTEAFWEANTPQIVQLLLHHYRPASDIRLIDSYIRSICRGDLDIVKKLYPFFGIDIDWAQRNNQQEIVEFFQMQLQ